jgi:2-oxoglutarate dehydrogenase E2 component (dihydrolipoamide succinyltransferase)
MQVEVKVPSVGESITEGILVEWAKADGDVVAMDEPLFSLETDKVTMTVNAENGGRLSIRVPEGETVTIGQVVGAIDTDAAGEAEQAPSPAPEQPSPAATEATEPVAPAPDTSPAMTTPAGSAQAHAKLADIEDLAPSVQRLVIEHHLDPKTIRGTGKAGRITKEDVLRHLGERDRTEATPVASPVVKMPPAPQQLHRESPRPAPSTTVGSDRTATRERMSPLRLRLAERLVQVQQTSAILTTFNEVDMSRVMALRARYKETFNQRHDVALGFMSFFVKAVVDALRVVPQVHSSIEGDEIVRHKAFDIGIAVSSDKGLVVPVVRNADRLSMAGVELAIADLAQRARDRTLTLSDLTGATFTISNGGIFGSMMSTPILNPPGSAILGMHAIKKRPVVVDDQIVIRPMMYLAVSYDHRLIDGREAVTFLKRIVETIEDPERLLLEV